MEITSVRRPGRPRISPELFTQLNRTYRAEIELKRRRTASEASGAGIVVLSDGVVKITPGIYAAVNAY